RHADTYALWGEPYAQVRDIIARVREAADGRRIGFNLSLRVILGDTEKQAWGKAADILAETKAKGGLA
ncbi:MAG TPA: LLM class flavin-dependent oxidoreductase, partial [Acidocella sp.]|nr:LLM class flavin-dependent oxidoreductase [Acidocella sp.]